MEQMNDLSALLMHDIQLLQSAEEQIIEALPAMIGKAQNPGLKKALQDHLAVTETHRDRLNNMRQVMNITEADVAKYTGVLAGLLGNPAKCKGMEGLVEEGQKLMAENLSAKVMDAAIIGSCQKIEHFEIASYGTARSFAEQLGMLDIATVFQQTLDEEYAADRTLSDLATSMINEKASVNI